MFYLLYYTESMD